MQGIPSVDQLRLLLSQDESATIEFKREWYRQEEDPRLKNLQKAEMVKDILAMANGSSESAGETAIMLVGVSSERSENGAPMIHDVGDPIPTAVQILDIVRPLSNPPMDSLSVIPFTCGATRLFAVVIPPTPHLYETSRPLETSGKAFSEHVVFIRRGDSVGVATQRERDAIRSLKAIRLSEMRNPSPTLFGGAAGATSGLILLGRITGRHTHSVEGAMAGGLVGAFLGAVFGALMGSSYEYLMQETRGWRQPQERRRRAITAASGIIVVAIWYLADKLGEAVLRTTRPASDDAKSGA